jgi:hypothetical protein
VKSRITTSLLGIAAVVAVACIDMSAPKGPAAISSLLLPSKAVVVGDVMRDSNGTPAPLTVIAYDANGVPLTDATPQYFITDTSHFAHLDNNSVLIGDKIGVAHLFSQVSTLQTAVADVYITSLPTHLVATSATDTTITAPIGSDSASSIGKMSLAVALRGASDSTVSGFIVKYVITHAPASQPGKPPAVYLGDENGKLMSRDTTEVSGAGASRTLYVNSLYLAGIDSAVVTATASYRGTTFSQVFTVKINVALGK